MDISLDLPQSKYFIRRFQPGEIIINETPYKQSIALSGTELISNWPPQTIGELKAEHLQALLAYQPEIILLGTGLKQIFPEPTMLTAIQAQGIGIEVMSTDAASRTFNILVSEDRKVIAALFL